MKDISEKFNEGWAFKTRRGVDSNINCLHTSKIRRIDFCFHLCLIHKRSFCTQINLIYVRKYKLFRYSYSGKEFIERPYHPIAPFGHARPTAINGIGPEDGPIIGGGYVGEGGVYQSRPLSVAGGPIISRPPLVSRCEEQENFRQVSPGTRVRKPFIRRYTSTTTLSHCEKECAEMRDFVCRSFNYRPVAYSTDRENCELSDRDSRDMEIGNSIYYDTGSDYDFYERNNGRQGFDECLDGK